jgi:hypothetical protein
MPYLSWHTLIVGEPCVQHLLVVTRKRRAQSRRAGRRRRLRARSPVACAIIYAAIDDMHQVSDELSAAVTADPTLVNRCGDSAAAAALAVRTF